MLQSVPQALDPSKTSEHSDPFFHITHSTTHLPWMFSSLCGTRPAVSVLSLVAYVKYISGQRRQRVRRASPQTVRSPGQGMEQQPSKSPHLGGGEEKSLAPGNPV